MYLFFLPVRLPSEIRKLPPDPPVRGFPSVWKLPLLRLPSRVGSPSLTLLSLSLSFFFFLNIYLFIWLCQVLGEACRIFSYGIWDLVPRPGVEPRPHVLGARSLSHWTTREAPCLSFLSIIFCPTSFQRQWAALLGAWCPQRAFRSCFVEFAQRSNVLSMNLWGRKWSPCPIPLPS